MANIESHFFFLMSSYPVTWEFYQLKMSSPHSELFIPNWFYFNKNHRRSSQLVIKCTWKKTTSKHQLTRDDSNVFYMNFDPNFLSSHESFINPSIYVYKLIRFRSNFLESEKRMVKLYLIFQNKDDSRFLMIQAEWIRTIFIKIRTKSVFLLYSFCPKWLMQLFIFKFDEIDHFCTKLNESNHKKIRKKGKLCLAFMWLFAKKTCPIPRFVSFFLRLRYHFGHRQHFFFAIYSLLPHQ